MATESMDETMECEPLTRAPTRKKNAKLSIRCLETNYYSLIVYFPRFEIPGGRGVRQGMFQRVVSDRVFMSTLLDDFHLADDVRPNKHGHEVKKLIASLDGSRFYVVTLFCRVRDCALKRHVDAICYQMNKKLDLYVDALRDDIADEWCSQELYRVYPQTATCLAGDTCTNNQSLCPCRKNFRAKKAIDALMPLGFEAD